MASFIGAIGSFVDGLLSLEVPGLGFSFLGLIVCLWLLVVIGYFVRDILWSYLRS